MAKEDYFLLDSRASVIALANDGKLETEDNGKYIIVVGTLKECCRDANRGDYGDGCVVSDSKFNILWELVNEHGHWIPKKIEV
jgi:hypothetical protein